MRQIRTMLTPAEYLERERVAACRSEYVNGEVQAMAGGSSDHDAICANIGQILGAQLRGRPCRVFTANFKVRIDKANVFRYPDLSGLCGPVLYHDNHRDAYGNPSLVIEVLSPSTEDYDRGEKFRLYRLLDSLFEYIMIRQDRVEVEVWTRGTDSTWTAVVYNERSDTISLTSLNCTLKLADVYEKVEFAA